jgi:hypothetical protein
VVLTLTAARRESKMRVGRKRSEVPKHLPQPERNQPFRNICMSIVFDTKTGNYSRDFLVGFEHDSQ